MELLAGVFAFWFVVVLVLMVVPFVLWVLALVDALRAPDAAYGPPWDNARNAWMVGFVVGLVIPAGMLVLPILWWFQGHQALRAGQRVPRPFWQPAPSYPYQGPPPPGHQPDVTRMPQ